MLRRMKRVLLLWVLAGVGLVGCATSEQPQVDTKILNEFTSRGVSAETASRVRDGRPLSVEQVAEAVSKGVPGPGLVSYMESTRKAYHLSASDVAMLRTAGAPTPLINAMRHSEKDFTRGPRAVDQKHPYFSEGNYGSTSGLRAPFAYDPPPVSTFYNSSYEENLYDPFSFQ